MAEQSVSLKHQLQICQQIARLIRARLPITGSLAELAKEAPVAGQASDVEQQVAQGKSLADALAGDGSRQSRILAACIESGELSDTLCENLESWTSTHIANSKSSKALLSAMVYPVLLILVTIISLASVIWKIIPQYREYYEMFHQELPVWLDTVCLVRERLGVFLFAFAVLAVLPLVIWFFRRRTLDRDGLPKDKVKRLRIQALASEIASRMLRAGAPIDKIAVLSCQAAGATQPQAVAAFEAIKQRLRIPVLAQETSMLLASTHCGVIDSGEAAKNLDQVAKHLRNRADITSTRNARWLPMLVALSVGTLTILTYLFLIYLPWIYLLQKVVAIPGQGN